MSRGLQNLLQSTISLSTTTKRAARCTSPTMIIWLHIPRQWVYLRHYRVVVGNGIFAHTLGIEFGMERIEKTGTSSELPLEVCRWIIDLGDYKTRTFENVNIRSNYNFNTNIPTFDNLYIGRQEQRSCAKGVQSDKKITTVLAVMENVLFLAQKNRILIRHLINKKRCFELVLAVLSPILMCWRPTASLQWHIWWKSWGTGVNTLKCSWEMRWEPYILRLRGYDW